MSRKSDNHSSVDWLACCFLVVKRGDLNRHCIFVKPIIRTIFCDRADNQDRRTLHFYSSRSSSGSAELMVDKVRNTFHFFNHMSNDPLNLSKSNEGREPYG
ncbi:hypothetical protein T10_10505 [Trichinella papuae]|uniref:Uncharacterized protein n=1 Tax=Trichinella papuae TaxID=268474 RepID=A0A0V1MW77_9BILA|nr:hypothetical protein T10_10505 [Trichinella papuae]